MSSNVINRFAIIFLTKVHYLFTGKKTNKKVNSMNFYNYRFMIHRNEDNQILKCQKLFHQFTVDMFVKTETERLTYIRKLQTEEYVPLRDVIDVNRNANSVGRLIILQRRMLEAQGKCINTRKML